MLTVIAILLALFVLPSPWNVIVILGAVAIDTTEVMWFRSWSRKRRATVGVETLVGRRAVVVRSLAPSGQVKLDGEVWAARSATLLEPGATVVVERVDGLTLDVVPEP